MAMPKVVVVGGGAGGVSAAQSLAGSAEVTLIERREYFEVPWPNVRVPVDKTVTEKSTFLMQDIPKLGKVLHNSVAHVAEHEVQLNDGSSVPFDYLVLATGSTWTDPVCSGTEVYMNERKQAQMRSFNEVKEARSVLIIGGGAVGVELAAEIAETYPDKHVTLVQSGKVLVPGYGARFSRRILEILRGLHVEVILEEKAQSVDGQYQLSKSGKTLKGDKVYVCVGGKPNTGFLKADSTKSILSDQGYVKVNQYLQVDGHSNWFALGDITSLSDYRLGRLAADQGKLVAANIKTLANASNGSARLKAWKKHNGLELICVSLGRNNGAMDVWGWGFAGWIPRMLKSRDLLLGMTRSNMGLAK